MSSVKQVLENSKNNVKDASYLIADIMKLRGQPPAHPLSSTEDGLEDILAHAYNRTGMIAAENVDTSQYPTNMSIPTAEGSMLGTGCAYELTGGRMEAGKFSTTTAVELSIGTENILCAGYKCRINDSGHAEYSPFDGKWLLIPAFANFTATKIISNPRFFVAVNEATQKLVLSLDLWVASKEIPIPAALYGGYGTGYYIDSFGRIFENAGDSANGVLAIYDNVFQSATPKYFGIPYGRAGLIQCTSGEFVEDIDSHEIWFNDLSNNVCYQLISDTTSEGTPYYEVPAAVIGSVYLDDQVVEVSGLGFVPDKVFIVARGEAHTNTNMWDVLLSSEYDLQPDETVIGQSFRRLKTETVATVGQTVTTNINSTKHSGYISGDGFVLHVPIDMVGTMCDYIAMGKSMGNEPWTS